MRIFKSQSLIGKNRIGIRKAKPVLPTQEHTHDYIEIVYAAHGTALEKVDGAQYQISRGDMIFMAPNSIHAFEPSEDFEHIEIFFSPHLVGEEVITSGHTLALLALTAFDDLRNDRGYGLVRFDRNDAREVEFILDAMQREYEEKKEGYEAFMCNCLNMLLIKMARVTSGATSSNDVWRAVEDYIDKNSDKRLSLSSIASKCFYNPSYFSRIFKQKYGVTFSNFVKAKRIERAKELLLAEKITVEEIFQAVGFTDRSAFFSAFYASTGKTPAQYRQQYKK